MSIIVTNKEVFDFLAKYPDEAFTAQEIALKTNIPVVIIFRIMHYLIGKNRKLFFINLIKSLDCKYLVASFSKKTISLKEMRNPERKWFESLLNKLGLKYKKLDFENEVFYLIKL